MELGATSVSADGTRPCAGQADWELGEAIGGLLQNDVISPCNPVLEHNEAEWDAEGLAN